VIQEKSIVPVGATRPLTVAVRLIAATTFDRCRRGAGGRARMNMG
jgi:transcriptional regulator of acetoin/glycerol metabolism